MNGFPAMQGELGCGVILLGIGTAIVLPAVLGTGASWVRLISGGALVLVGLAIVVAVLWLRRPRGDGGAFW